MTQAAREQGCEYARCGGLGHRRVKRPRRAQVVLTIGTREWHVCESCSDLLLSEARAEGLSVLKHGDGRADGEGVAERGKS